MKLLEEARRLALTIARRKAERRIREMLRADPEATVNELADAVLPELRRASPWVHGNLVRVIAEAALRDKGVLQALLRKFLAGNDELAPVLLTLGLHATELKVMISGNFIPGFFGEGAVKICSNSRFPVRIMSVTLRGPGVKGRLLGFSPTTLQPGECVKFKASILTPGSMPVKLIIDCELPGGARVRIPALASLKAVSAEVAMQSPPRHHRLPAPQEIPTITESIPFYVGKVLTLHFIQPQVTPLRTGLVIAGLEIRGLVGIGGFAATLLGVDEVGRSFILKVPRDVYEAITQGLTYAPSKEGLKIFIKEYEVLKSLEHPHLIRVIDGGTWSSIPYIIMEYCGNGSLRGVLETQGRLSLEDTALIGLQVANALTYLHSREVVHADLKPENILFTNEGLLKVTDFNIAKVMKAATTKAPTKTPYTPGYAAPEQVLSSHGEVGPWSDIWSLGIILYEALTDEPPFNPWNYENAIINEEPDLTNIPSEVSDIVRKMLSLNPKERPTAKEVEEELAKVLTELMRK